MVTRRGQARPALALGLAVGLAGLVHSAAAQSNIGSAFPGVARPVPSPSSGPPPPAIAPGPAGPIAPGPAAPVAPGPAAPQNMGQHAGRSRLVTVPGLPPVLVPQGPRGRDSHQDRVSRCVHYGTVAGVPPSEIGRFTAYCIR